MSRDIAEEVGLPPVDQVAWIVHDLDRALETFAPMFGPFDVMEQTLTGTLYRGRPSDVSLRMAFGRSGPLEIELIEPVSGEGPHREMLDKHGEGVHHVRFRVIDLDQPVKRLEALGFRSVWSHEMPEVGARWAYLEAPEGSGGALVELVEFAEAPKS